jgi:hypothetical protein
MALIDRVLGQEEPKLPVHQFMAALAEYKRGAITGAQVVSAFNLSQAETTQLQSFLSRLDSNNLSREMIHDILMLGEYGLYNRSFVLSRLGF